MVRQIRTETVRQHELSDRKVRCPNAREGSNSYYVFAKTGNWITYHENDGDGMITHTRSGRMLGRVDAPSVPHDTYPCEQIEGYLSVLSLSDNLQHAYIRWIKPEDVMEVSQVPPAGLLAFITGPMPDAAIVHQLSAYGTLSETYIGHVPHHVTAFKAGMSPIAYDLDQKRKAEAVTE